MGLRAIHYFAFAISLLSAHALGQHHPISSSLETYVSGAERIYVGKITEISEKVYSRPTMEYVLTIEVSETLKGQPVKTCKVRHYENSAVFANLKATDTPVLFYCGNPKEGDEIIPGQRYASLDPKTRPTHCMTMDFHVVGSTKEMLSLTRKFVKEIPHGSPSHGIYYLPNLFAPYTGHELIVPVCPRLETLARKMILTPDQILPRRDQVKNLTDDEYRTNKAHDVNRVRRMGIQALRHFQSDRNILLLKQHLEDPFVENYWDTQKNVYSIRMEAYNALTSWGVEVRKPVLIADGPP